ncbi:unnamed protein product [Ixodes hexagonus]
MKAASRLCFLVRSRPASLRRWVRCACSGRSDADRLIHLIASMPKEPTAAKELRAQRVKAKAAPRPRPSEITLCVLGNGGPGNPRSLYVITDQSRYMFNCGEGTQRLAHEHKMKLSKLENIFFTHNAWSNLGGLPGMALTVQDIGVPELCLHGPVDVEQLFDMTKGFMLTDRLNIVKRKPSDGPYTDHCMEVQYVPLLPRTTGEQPCKKLKSESEEYGASVVAYICKPHSKPGQLHLEKCVNLGVPPGPLLGELKNGRDITLPNGTLVKSSDVVSPDEPGPVFIVVEVPSEEYLDSLLESGAFASHQATAFREQDAARVVVHFSPPSVMERPAYLDWITRFPASTLHLALNEYAGTLSSAAVHRAQHRLHLLSDSIFPLLHVEEPGTVPKELRDANVQAAETLTRLRLRPNLGLQRDAAVRLDPDAYVQEAWASPGFSDRLQELKTAAAQRQGDSAASSSYPEILFLGTASAIPGKDRNVSAVLVNLREDLRILLDCGEGTLNQLVRFYGIPRANKVLATLGCVLVSHLHADHHLGLISLLRARGSALKRLGLPLEPVPVAAPQFMVPWTAQYHRTFEPISHLFTFVDNALLLWDQPSPTEERTDLIRKLKLNDLSSVLVKHCRHAYGFTLTTEDGWKLTYSGDTMPCEDLVQAGAGSDILIHEATMEDDLAEEALLKTHSTTSQAIDVGSRMRARFTLLTHFSQRYAKLPLVSDRFHASVGCAFDHMLVRPCDLPVLPLLFPALKSLFAEHYQEMCDKTAKKLRQKALQRADDTLDLLPTAQPAST